MATWTFTIKDTETQARILAAIKGLHPIPMIPIDADDPKSDLQPEYKDGAWAKKNVIDYLKNLVRRYEALQARQAINIDIANDSVV